jgi:hypothetical protein
MTNQLKLGIKAEMEHAHLFPKNLRKTMATRIAKNLSINNLKAITEFNKILEKERKAEAERERKSLKSIPLRIKLNWKEDIGF